MGTIISVDFQERKIIQRTEMIHLTKASVHLDHSMILPAQTGYENELAVDHAAEPIKSLEDIERIQKHLIDHERWRDNMLFIVGINLGLRVSDLLQLRFGDLINSDFTFKQTFAILEKKTKNTRKVQRNRYLTINEAVIEAVTLYLQHHPSRLDDFMFKGESNRCGSANKPMSTYSVERILKGIASDLGIGVHVATHTLRKTFGYHQMQLSGNDPRKLLLLQKMFGHSSSMQTLEYIGITSEEIAGAYLELNLGSRYCYGKFSEVKESSLA